MGDSSDPPGKTGFDERVTALLAGKVVAVVKQYRPPELVIEFTDGTRLFVDGTPTGLELSITGGPPDDGGEIPSEAVVRS